jgi:hypothetical protein
MPTSGNAFARRVLLQIFPIPAKSFPILADFYLSHVAPLYGPVVSLDEIGARYRVHGNNTYELADHIVDLKHVRQTIIYAANTEAQIERYARQLGLRSRGTPTTAGSSVSCIAHRLISLKLEPALHPIPEDRVAKLLQRGVTAALRRFDVTWPVRLVFIAWFLALALAPRTMAHWLAARFLFPEKRRGVTQVLRRFHRRTETAHILQLTDDQP